LAHQPREYGGSKQTSSGLGVKVRVMCVREKGRVRDRESNAKKFERYLRLRRYYWKWEKGQTRKQQMAFATFII
jgi:hypothetical protein